MISTDTLNAFVREGAPKSKPDASRAERVASFDLADFPPPTGREEEWRFTPTRRFRDLLAGAASPAELSIAAQVPSPATLTTVSLDEARTLGISAPADRLAALAVANAPEVTKLTVPANAELDEPIRLTLTGTGDELVWRHLVIEAQPHSKATVVLLHNGSAQISEVVSAVLRDGANLTVVAVQDWSNDAIHAGQHDAVVGRDASYTYVPVTLGGAAVRLNANVAYTGPGGEAKVLGVYFADSGQHLEHRSFVDHNQPRCSSDVTYKGALQGAKARTVWVGDVLIRADAIGTDTYEINRNLLLTEGARADSVPNLEIETGEIKGAGHASATGRFDDQQLFYLQARGIPESVARRLVVRGFFADIIARINIPEIVEHLMVRIDEELAMTMGVIDRNDPVHAVADEATNPTQLAEEEN